MSKDRQTLALWQERLEAAKTAYEGTLAEMDRRDAMYRGGRDIRKSPNSAYKGPVKRAGVVQNVAGEIVEAQVSSDIPSPKVTPWHKEDEPLAATIENMLRNELDRLPFEVLNDQDERTTPVQGGNLFLVEWDAKRHTHTAMGGLSVSLIHPKQFIPQPGVNEIRDMDYCFLQMAQTKDYIRHKYHKDVTGEGEERPESRTFDVANADDVVTQNIGYFRNKRGGIGRVSWVNDVLLEYMEDYQARRFKRCVKCGQTMDDECKYCGGRKADEQTEDVQTLYEDVQAGDMVIPAFTTRETMALDEMGNPIVQSEEVPTEVPYYKPDVYPIVLRRNVSVFGQLLGSSDVDMIADQQDEINKVCTKISEKLMAGGSILTLPQGKRVERHDGEYKVVEIKDPAERGMIDVLTLQADISKDMTYRDSTYQAARNLIGVTDSFQGRKDTTATSGKAKEFAAAQTAGRLESKKTMKNAAYADLFEIMFRFMLAYSDEPRPVVSRGLQGEAEYQEFNKWDFLRVDDAGDFYWDDEFLFSVDQTAPLAGNREAMWQETRMNLKDGCFGNPTEIDTLIMFWDKMDALHYPGAKETAQQMRQKKEEQQMMMQMMQQAMPGAMQQQPAPGAMPQPDPVQGFRFGDSPPFGGTVTGGAPDGMPQM